MGLAIIFGDAENGVTTCLNLDMSLNSVFQAWVDSGIRGIGAITTADMWIPDVLKEEPIQLREKVLSLSKMAFIRRKTHVFM